MFLAFINSQRETMSNVIYHNFKKNNSGNKENSIETISESYVKVLTYIGKTGEKFLCMKFDSILKITKIIKKNLDQEKQKSGIELLKESMDKLYKK